MLPSRDACAALAAWGVLAGVYAAGLAAGLAAGALGVVAVGYAGRAAAGGLLHSSARLWHLAWN